MNPHRRLALATLLLALAACAPPGPDAPPGDTRYERIVTLAPNLTELVFAAGAGARLVGVSAYSDYPPAARQLPVVGDAFTIDRERLALLDPDALFVWESGTPAHVVDELRAAGFTVEVLKTQGLADVAASLRRIGELTGHTVTAAQTADDFLVAVENLRRDYADRPAISVFYQVSKRPLFTINGEHFVGELITLCGGRNVFADLAELAPTIDVEAVVTRDPEVMLTSTDGGPEAFDDWARWPTLVANRYGNHFRIPADEIGRATPRVLVAAQAICEVLEEARQRRAHAAAD